MLLYHVTSLEKGKLMSLIEKITWKITHMFDCENENPEKELLIVLAIFGAFMIEQAIATWYQYGI
jgi:hypothetical protein